MKFSPGGPASEGAEYWPSSRSDAPKASPLAIPVLIRQPHEDESRFFRLPADGRVPVVAIVSTGYRQGEDGLVPFRVTFTVFPADRNQFVIDYGAVPREPPGPAEDWRVPAAHRLTTATAQPKGP
jgi:hypothetical protein